MFSSKYLIKTIFSFCFLLIVSISAAMAQDGPLNLGFEDGVSNWEIIEPVAESIVVKSADGPVDSTTYADLNLTVKPFDGSNMLRLGTPKQKNEKMEQGSNTITQTFNSFNDSVVISFRLFGWEHREERDTFTVDIKKNSDHSETFPVSGISGSDTTDGLSVDMIEGYSKGCTRTPCVLEITSGDRGEFIDTKWQRMIITGLPTNGSEVTISYSLDGVNDSGHPVWAYVDHGNTKPVANFTVSRESTTEGNVSRFIDKSTDPDPFDKITARTWEISYDGGEPEIKYNAKEISVISSNDGEVTAKLTVYDRFGANDEINSSDPDPSDPNGIKQVPSITYVPGPILINNLDTYYVVAGSKGNIISARYAKPGWDDDVTATWSNDGSGSLDQVNKNNIKYNVPMMLKGITSIPYTAPDEVGITTETITLTLSSDDVAPVTKNITINILPKSVFTINQNQDTPSSADDGVYMGSDDKPTDATTIKSGNVHVGHLYKAGDIDYYEIKDPNGNKFPVGSEIVVRLRNVSTDHDLYVLSKLPAGSETAYDNYNQKLKDLFAFGGDQARLYGFSGDASRLFGFSGDQARLYAFGGDQARLFGFSGDSARLYAFSGDTARLFAFSGDQARLFGFSGDQARLYAFGGDAARLFAFSGDSARLFSFSGDMTRLEESDPLNSVESVVFSSPVLTGLSWEEAASKGALHSMWLRDSELDPFSVTSLDNGFNFDQIPLTEALYLPLQGSAVGNKDIDVNETPVREAINNGYQLLAFSANDGYNDELVILRVSAEQDIYIAVASEGEFGSPYSLQVENSGNTNLAAISNGACTGKQLVTPSSVDTTGIIYGSDDTNKVMYVVNPKRMSAKYDTKWDSLLTELTELAELEGGKILAIDHSNAYATMDTEPCIVENANAVAHLIRQSIKTFKGGAKSVVIVGGDDIIPHYRVTDPTDFTERDYVGLTSLGVSSPLYSAMFHSNILTDKYYASDYSVENMPFKLLIPEWPVSRLVETPEDISASIKTVVHRHEESDPHLHSKLDAQTAMVTSYDVVYDSGQQIEYILSEALGGTNNVAALPFDIITPWGKSNIECNLLGVGYKEDGTTECDATDIKDIISLNGHFSHDRLITQKAFDEGINDYVTANDINSNMSGNYIYTPGCHAGLNIPKQGEDPTGKKYADFPASYINNGVTYLAGTGFGIAGVNTSVYSEKLMLLHTLNLVQGGEIGTISTVTDKMYMLDAMYKGIDPYDIKAMYQNTLYGFTTRIITPGYEPVLSPTVACDSSIKDFTLTVLDNESSVTTDPVFPVKMKKVCSASSGDYYEVDGKTTSVVNRPVVPLTNFKYTSNAGEVRSIIIESASFEEQTNFDPVFVTPTTDNNNQSSEFAFCQDGRYWPSKLVDFSDDGTDTYVNFVSGQFICTNNENYTGTQRLYTAATIRVLRSNSDDYIPPAINSLDSNINEQGNLIYYVDAYDKSGIQEIVVTIYHYDIVTGEGMVTTQSFENPVRTNDGRYFVELNQENTQSALGEGSATTVTVIDNNNMMAIEGRKGRGIKQVVVDINDSNPVINESSPNVLTATIHDFVTKRDNGLNSMSYIWDYGDKEIDTGYIFNGSDDNVEVGKSLQINPIDKTATFTTTHQYDGSDSCDIKVKFKVTDSSGGIGSDEVILINNSEPSESINYPDFPELANSDLTGCYVESDNTRVNIGIRVLGNISTDVQYRLHVDFNNDNEIDMKVIYDNGKFTKTNVVNNLNVTEGNGTLEFSFDAAPAGWIPGMPLIWNLETQSGVPGAPAIGRSDSMPDDGYYSYTK